MGWSFPTLDRVGDQTALPGSKSYSNRCLQKPPLAFGDVRRFCVVVWEANQGQSKKARQNKVVFTPVFEAYWLGQVVRKQLEYDAVDVPTQMMLL